MSNLCGSGRVSGADRILERGDAVVSKPRWSTPHGYVAMRQVHANGLVGSVETSKQEHGWNSKGYRDDGLRKVLLVLILVQR